MATTRITLKRGDITRERVDAIVNAANSGLRGGGGVDGAIHEAGGPEIMIECRRLALVLGGCPPGRAVVTTAGRLAAGCVVHTVGPIWRGGGFGEPAILAASHRASLEAAAGQGARTIAFPAISTGLYGYPIDRAATIAIETALEFTREHDDLEEIRFVLFTEPDLAAYQTALRAATGHREED